MKVLCGRGQDIMWCVLLPMMKYPEASKFVRSNFMGVYGVEHYKMTLGWCLNSDKHKFEFIFDVLKVMESLNCGNRYVSDFLCKCISRLEGVSGVDRIGIQLLPHLQDLVDMGLGLRDLVGMYKRLVSSRYMFLSPFFPGDLLMDSLSMDMDVETVDMILTYIEGLGCYKVHMSNLLSLLEHQRKDLRMVRMIFSKADRIGLYDDPRVRDELAFRIVTIWDYERICCVDDCFWRKVDWNEVLMRLFSLLKHVDTTGVIIDGCIWRFMLDSAKSRYLTRMFVEKCNWRRSSILASYFDGLEWSKTIRNVYLLVPFAAVVCNRLDIGYGDEGWQDVLIEAAMECTKFKWERLLALKI